jgi:hypothetical protein
MNTRPTRNRKVLRLESLEIRNAPSHFGVLGHAAVAVHKLHTAAHVRRFSDSPSNDKHETQESNSGADRSQDRIGAETSSPDRNSNDPTSNDPSSNDPSSIDQTTKS